jgi:hypothetical protein
MKIQDKLVEMVADLNSEERQKREEVEAILSQIHELTEPFFNPDAPVVASQPEEAPAPVLSQAEKLKNFTGMFERKGLPPDLAVDKAEEILGMRDGSR